MRKLALATFALALSVASAFAQNVAPGEIPHPGAGAYNSSPPTCTNGQFCMLQTDVNGQLKISGSIAATIAGFTPGLTFASLTAAGTSGSVALPAGAVVAFQNTGTTTVSCTLGVGSATAVAGQVQVPASSTVFLTVGSNTFGACIDESGSVSNVVRLAGGTGLGTGFGGGGGGAGGSSSITNWGGGVLGAMANYGTSPGAVLVPGVNAFVTNTQAAVGNNADGIAAGASAASPVANYNYNWNGTTWDRQKTVVLNPCETVAQSYATGVITSATTTRIVPPSASNKTYACMFFTKASAADNVGVVEGTGGTCGTGTAAVLGGTTAANGLVFGTAGDGVLLQLGGKVSAMQTAGTNVDLCLITSTAGPLIYSIKYVQAP